MEPIRIFIGTEPKTEIARKVLECSISRRTDGDVEFVPMIGPRWEYGRDGIKVGTGFSLRRWMIPAYCGWAGKAIYMDADQLVFGDVAELWQADRVQHRGGVSAWMTFQPDKFSNEPWPQSSVMLIDCAAARGQWGWDLERVLAYLRTNTEVKPYADLMHATWMDPQPVRIPTEWNHLNEYKPGRTRLLHYTKEPEQPWYRPDHPHADLWRKELNVAIERGFIDELMFRDALAQWGVKEDWRDNNGLHPDYAVYLKRWTTTGTGAPKGRPLKAPAGPGKPPKPSKPPAPAGEPRQRVGIMNHSLVVRRKRKILWVSTCPVDMWAASGEPLVRSFIRHKPPGYMLMCLEGMPTKTPTMSTSVIYEHLDGDERLAAWLKANEDIIPQSLGGLVAAPECRCLYGPKDVHAKDHTLPCVGHWFCKNASRWFRKIVALGRGLAHAARHEVDTLIWLDADCQVKTKIDVNVVNGWFHENKGAFYLKHTRPLLEAGVLGFDLANGGGRIIEDVAGWYDSGAFRAFKRWDDCQAWQWFFDRAACTTIDIATGVGPHAAVVENSALAAYLSHAKGRHGRILGIMT